MARALRHCLLAYERYDARWRQQSALNGNEKLVLMLVGEGATATPSELSRAIGMTSAGMTNLLDRLEGEGYVRRERHWRDRRRVLVVLTERGTAASTQFESVNAEMLRHVADGDAPVLLSFLQRAAEAFEAGAAPR